MTDPQPTAATDDVVDLVRITCDEKFGNLVGELTSHRDAAAFVAALEQRGVVLTLEGELDRGTKQGVFDEPASPAFDVVVNVTVHAEHDTLPQVLDALRGTHATVRVNP
ncbi:hypothetical protein [Cellulosimicrobium sp. SH8]|uniref:hypothetical protein n=1 Tax=Cellulosimicrobium sp. SH8 TaxID=2952936 RepID=UPI0021F2B175|nr:hypothetical protein [Cellulosimicrobium sp. SH8]